MGQAQGLSAPAPWEADSIPIIASWLAKAEAGRAISAHDDPNYYADDPKQLISTSQTHRFMLGTGEDVYSSMIPSIQSADSELILVTCFWAASKTLDKLNTTLRGLSDKAIRRGAEKIKVHICFSSCSLFQKLFHTMSPQGRTWDPSTWTKRLGLPSPAELSGLELQVKSIFFLPFSVMHPKFIVIDRKKVFLPSCNVSWEAWFEGAIELSGPIVTQFIRFWECFWNRRGVESLQAAIRSDSSDPRRATATTTSGYQQSLGPAFAECVFDPRADITSIFLPSPHHINPKFQPFARQSNVRPPSTPLNDFLLSLLEGSSSTIYMQTPNLTSPPVLSALLSAVRRGVNVHIVTSERLMILEQLVTAGTTTKRCMKKLVKRYRRSSAPLRKQSDEERAMQSPGSLRIEFYQAKALGIENEPVQSHLKLTIVDEEWIILGSGNMDRASWFTSQELGVAFRSQDVVLGIQEQLFAQLSDRKKAFYDSS